MVALCFLISTSPQADATSLPGQQCLLVCCFLLFSSPFIVVRTRENGRSPSQASHYFSFQRQFHWFLVPRGQPVLRDDAGTGVPAEQSIVVSRRTNRFGVFITSHGLAQAIVG